MTSAIRFLLQAKCTTRVRSKGETATGRNYKNRKAINSLLRIRNPGKNICPIHWSVGLLTSLLHYYDYLSAIVKVFINPPERFLQGSVATDVALCTLVNALFFFIGLLGFQSIRSSLQLRWHRLTHSRYQLFHHEFSMQGFSPKENRHVQDCT